MVNTHKNRDVLHCSIPECRASSAHRVHKFNLCTVHHREYANILQVIQLVPLEDKEDTVVNLMYVFEFILRE
jgi:hypothetical protein